MKKTKQPSSRSEDSESRTAEKKKSSVSQIFRDYWFLLKPQFQYALGYNLVCLLLRIGAEVLQTGVSIYFYMTVIHMVMEGRPLFSIVGVATLFLLAKLMSNFLFYEPITRIVPGWSQKIDCKIYSKVVEQAVYCDYKNYDNPQFYHDYTLAINDYMKKSWKATTVIESAVSCVVSCVMAVSFLSQISLSLVGVCLAAVVVQIVIKQICIKIGASKWETYWQTNRKFTYIQRLLYIKDFAQDIRATRLSDKIFSMHGQVWNELGEVDKKYRWKQIFSDLSQHLVSFLVEYAGVIYAVSAVLKGLINIGDFTGVVSAAERMYIYGNGFSRGWTDLCECAEYSRRIQRFFHASSEIEKPRGMEETVAVAEKKPFSVELKNVSFTYSSDPSARYALKDISMSIQPGEKIAVVGENGAGKSTLTKLLLRLYDSSCGEILINGAAIQDYDIHELRRDIGMAFQETNVYAMSLADNMKLYRNVSEEKLMEAAKELGLDRILDKFHCGFDAPVTREFDENGIILSGGEKQRLGLARLFTGTFGLLILDEPSAALDPVAEYELNQMILSLKNTTTIMISHRLSTVVDADCIYLIENGEIVEHGTHRALMQLNGKYAAMFRMQAEKYREGSTVK